MADGARPSQEELIDQIEKYVKAKPRYEAYARALEQVSKKACKVAVPEAVVQARPKSVSSFAEKCVRKWAKYAPDPVEKMTDLCGARIIAQTLQQVEAVKQFIEHNFIIHERDDKGLLLGDDRFGYRDMHYLVQIKPERAEAIGFTPEDIATIGEAIAEVQVRSLVQHAWADILHDRMYKASLKVSAQAKRTGALLAAMMEEGERSFGQLAGELDGMAANYSAYARPEDVNNEIDIHKLLLQSEKQREQVAKDQKEKDASREEQVRLALRLARMVASKGQWQEAVDYLLAYEGIESPIQMGIHLELGHSLCRKYRDTPAAEAYLRGQDLLRGVISGCEQPKYDSVQNLRRDRSIYARALARLAWSYEVSEADAYRARENYRKAVEAEPQNPYYLADMLGFELKFAADKDVVASFRSTIRGALAACRQHSAAGTELPAALFTAGRLALLLGENSDALNDYAKAVHHCLRGEACVRCRTLDEEIAWLHRVYAGKALPEGYDWAEQLLKLARQIGAGGFEVAPAAAGTGAPSVIMVVGGAASLAPARQQPVANMLADALESFSGKVISGGTDSGVPGAVGMAAAKLKADNRKQFTLVGYIPRLLPHDAKKDDRYDQTIVCGDGRFSLMQVLASWQDLLKRGTKPEQVLCLGYGGGAISAFEYRLALALGASVAVVEGSGAAVTGILEDPYWTAQASMLPIPEDAKTIRALVIQGQSPVSKEHLLEMAKDLHKRYRTGNEKKIKPDALKPWECLPATYQGANLAQAAYAIQILNAAGFGVGPADGTPITDPKFTDAEVELMAELEHGRWNVERLRDGWRRGPKDEEKKLHNCLVSWNDKALTEEIRGFDREAVKLFPQILAKAGLEVYRK